MELHSGVGNHDNSSAGLDLSEVSEAIGKHEGLSGLSSDHFIKAGTELAVHIRMLFSDLLFHGYAPHSMSECTVISISKGSNKADSANYRGIALFSIFAKVFDFYRNLANVSLLRICSLDLSLGIPLQCARWF